MKKLIWLPVIILSGFVAGAMGSVVAAPLSEDSKLQVISGGFAAIADALQVAIQGIIQIVQIGIAG